MTNAAIRFAPFPAVDAGDFAEQELTVNGEWVGSITRDQVDVGRTMAREYRTSGYTVELCWLSEQRCFTCRESKGSALFSPVVEIRPAREAHTDAKNYARAELAKVVAFCKAWKA